MEHLKCSKKDKGVNPKQWALLAEGSESSVGLQEVTDMIEGENKEPIKQMGLSDMQKQSPCRRRVNIIVVV